MVSLAHGKSSSSPSVRIDFLQEEGTERDLLRVRLDDGSLFLLDIDHPLVPSLEIGMVVDETLGQALAQAVEFRTCRRKALDLLAIREHCRRDLERKLLQREYSRPAIVDALDRLENRGWLDDHRFAEAWLRSRIRSHPEGPARLLAGLAAKGVAGNVAKAALETVFLDIDGETISADELLERAATKLLRKASMTPKKLQASLVRRGFSVVKIHRWIREHHSPQDQ